jgi:hypothetical protein
MVGTIIGETKAKAKERPNDAQLTRTKNKGQALIPLVLENYLTHNPSNVTYMQIVRSNSN